jgi:hypothetical protein
VKAPTTKLVPVRLISGELFTAPHELAILLVIPQGLEQAELEIWTKGTGPEKTKLDNTKLESGLLLIHPGVYFRMPDNVAFAPLICKLDHAE